MDTFKVIFNPEETDGVFCISLVEDPAIESHFIAMSKPQELKLATVDEEKRILLGPILIPDKLILRKDSENGAYNITFPADTIRLAMHNFAKQGYHNNSTLEHDQEMKLSGVTFVESWIKEDDVNDKSVKYGYDEPVGTWFATMKVDSDEVWNDYVKTGKVKGFSIDGLFGLEKINLNKSEMERPKWLDGFVTELKDIFAKEKVELGKTTANDGSLEFEWEGDTVTPGETQISMKDSAGELVNVPDGTYTVELETGKKKWTVVGSIVTEESEYVEEVVEEAPATLTEDPAKAAEVKSEKFTQEVIYATTEMAKVMADTLEKKFADFETKIDARLAKVEEVEAISLTKQKGQQQKAWEEMTALERRRATKNL